MTAQLLHALGGLGLFLLGMIVLTEGLRAVAGDAVHRVLQRFTKSPTSGAATGAAVTAVLQSSSVTTVTTVGFVSAGLVTFSESLGLILGANIGTTSTGWIVSMVGLKFKVSALALPLVGDEIAHRSGGLDATGGQMTATAAARGSNHPGFDEIGEPVLGGVDREEAGNRPPPIGDDDLLAGTHSVEVSAEVVLELPNPDLGSVRSHIHETMVATSNGRSRAG